ncbi:MAG TPA: glycoside hydrolase family 16 protein [Iamia sp.]|nr:glycoside hydrolase family 16 protein [Iamia sp.]
MSLTRTPRHQVTALLAGLALATTGLVACEPEPSPPPAPPASGVTTADIDTFAVSVNPSSTRGNDTVLRIMDSAGKLKVGYISFPVAAADTSSLEATLGITPRHSGFALEVHNTGSFTNDTTFETRPALGAEVGTLASTTAGTRQRIALSGVRVSKGRAYLAITTSSDYELEITSTEGAPAAGKAPALDITPDDTPPPPTTPTPPTTQPSGPDDWRLSWSDEFNGTQVDGSKWNVYDEATPWNSVESPKASTCPKASNVSLSGGLLIMRTKKANGACAGGQAQSGAGMNTWGKFEQAQGRFEARVRWTAEGNNLWGGFWTHANGGPGYDKTKASELDVFEYIGKTAQPNINRYKPAIHFNYTCNPKCMQNVPVMDFQVTDWHTYGVEWEPTVRGDPTSTQIRFYLDGVQVAQFDRYGAWQVNPNGTKVMVHQGSWTNSNGPFPTPFGPDRAHKIVLSAWVGAPTVDAATIARGYDPPGGHADLQVDWVRVYKR